MTSINRLLSIMAVAILAIVVTDAEEKICGSTLRSTMDLLCHGRFQTMYDVKRSGAVDKPDGAVDTYDWLFNPQSPRHPRIRRSPSEYDWYVAGGISDLCCDNACSIKTMLSFCKN